MASGLKGYVQRHDPAGATDQLTAPQPSRPPTAQKTRNAQEHDGQHNVYGTDTEGFDDTRSSSSKQANSEGAYDAEEHDQEEQRGLDRILDLDPEQLNQALWQMRHHQSTGNQVSSDPESYPPTTSGDPEPMEEYEAQDGGGFVPQPAQAYVEQPHDAYTTNIPPERHRPALTMPIQQRHVGPSKDDFKTQAKPTLTQKDVLRQKMLQSKAQVTSQDETLNQHRRHGPHIISHKHPSKSPDHAPPAAVEQLEHSRRQATQIKLEGADRHNQDIDGAIYRRQRANRAERYDQSFDRADLHEQHVNGHDHYEQQELDHPPEESHGQVLQPEELDYDLHELFNKDLDELQGDPFEGPLREEPDVPPSDFSSKPLDGKLTLAAKFEPPQQKAFLASLTIDEWERAGDWFHDRFSDVFGKLKDARRERRRLAMDFEQRIAERQQEVSKKRKITEEALSGMKVTGAQVLDGTPKKKQKFRERHA